MRGAGWEKVHHLIKLSLLNDVIIIVSQQWRLQASSARIGTHNVCEEMHMYTFRIENNTRH